MCVSIYIYSVNVCVCMYMYLHRFTVSGYTCKSPTKPWFLRVLGFTIDVSLGAAELRSKRSSLRQLRRSSAPAPVPLEAARADLGEQPRSK
jgi:hypothetical protein